METKNIILRLKSATYKYSEAGKIKEEIRQLPLSRQQEILAELRIEKGKSDNSNLIDVINDIINDARPK